MRPSRPLTETKNDTENENTKKKSDKLKVTERERVREKRVGTYKEKHLREITRNVHSIRDRNNYLKQVSPTKKNMLSQPPNLIYFDTYTKKTKIL